MSRKNFLAYLSDSNFHVVAINFEEKTVHSPIKMVYAGSLYCNRWKTLSVIGNAMKIINEGSKRIEMYVYSQSVLTEKTKRKQ